MRIIFRLKEEDIIDLNLYLISVSGEIQRTKNQNRWVLPAISLPIIVAFATEKLLWVPGAIILLSALLWFVFFPSYSKKRERQNITKYVRANFGNMLLEDHVMELTDDLVVFESKQKEERFRIESLVGVVRRRDRIYLLFQTGEGVVIPKLENEEWRALIEKLEKISEKRGVPFENINE